MNSLLDVDDLHVRFGEGSSLLARLRRHQRLEVRALDGVSLRVPTGASLGIVGESGSGKSTLARVVTGLVQPTQGTVRFRGRELGPKRNVEQRRRIQMVFQDPVSSLNPSMTVGAMLAELLHVHKLVPASRVHQRCEELLELVELPTGLLQARPRRLSGGQRQRVAIARALAVEPQLLIADEAVAALDVSIQAAVLNLLADLRERLGLTLVFISHDLTVVRHVCDRIAVMYLGRIVEEADTETLFSDPRHPYTRALLDAVPLVDQRRVSGDAALHGEPPSPIAIPAGCRFHPRCPIATDRCPREDPMLEARGGHSAACHYAWS